MCRTLALALCAAALPMTSVPVVAHHAFAAEFDANKPITLEGTVTKMDWINPHSWIYIDVNKPDGTVEKWAIEAGAPNAMFRRGFRKDSLPAGTFVRIDGWMAKNRARTANGRSVRLPNGQTLFVGSSGTGAPVEPPTR